MQTRKGQSIEDASMRMIDEEVGAHGFGEAEWPVVRRVIHTTADFDFAGGNAMMLFSKNAVGAGIAALRGGCSIVTDVSGVYAGMNKQNPKNHGNRVVCRISDGDVAARARREDTTRSAVSMRMSAGDIDGGVVAVGNAPTALLEVVEMIREGAVRPALVVGIPVGFISAAESKETLVAAPAGTEYISNRGRKGGSAVAAAVINALYKLAAA